MLRLRHVAIGAMVLACAGFTRGLADSEPKHLSAARRLVAALKPADTSYQHKHGFVVWPEQNKPGLAEAHVDCSGFIDALLAHTHALTADNFAGWLGKRRPLAEDYHDAILAQREFALIGTVAEIQPGDLLAIKFPPGTSEDTGHIMLVNGAPRRRTATMPVIDGTQQWEVSVIDSSSSGHGPTDTRHQPDGSFRDGVGQGVFRLYSNPDGSVAGYCWSTGGKSKYYDQSTRNLVAGRLTLP